MAVKLYGHPWSDSYGENPIPHGTAAESYLMAGIDVMQQGALWGSIPHWSANVFHNRAAAIVVPVVIPPWVNQVTPQIVAAGNGSIKVGAGLGSVVVVDGDEDETSIDSAVLYTGPLLTVSTPYDGAGGDAIVKWIPVDGDADVHVFAMGFLYGRANNSL